MAGNSPLLVGSGAKARRPLIASSSAPLLVSTDGFLAGGASVTNVATSMSRDGGGRATSHDEASMNGLVVASERGYTSLVPGDKVMEALKDEAGVIRGLEGALESGEATSSDRLRYYLEILESAAEAREAAASWLRTQIRQAAREHPGIFDTPIASDCLSQSLYSDHGSLFGPDCAEEKYEEEARETGVAPGVETKKDVSGGIGGQEDAIDGSDSDCAGAKPPEPGQEVATVTKDVTMEIERGEGDANRKGVVELAGKLLRQVLHVSDRSERQDKVGNDSDDRAAVVAAVVAAAVEEVVVTSSPSPPDTGEADDTDEFGVEEGKENNADFDTEGDKSAGFGGVESPPAKDVAVDM